MRSGLRRMVGVGIVGLALVGGGWSPAFAHEGHGSCGDAAQTSTVPVAQAGELGEFASTLGMAGLADDTAGAAHAALCEPRP